MGRATPNHETSHNPDLPIYTILIPLYCEAEILPDLIDTLSNLDYPPAKLDAILILEEVDKTTQAAAATADRPGFMRVIIVPDAQPRTKPKALNFAMQFAKGEFVVVYDAEDMPDPGQLKSALAMFRSNQDKPVACVQAKLNLYNRRTNWLTRQFTFEYTSLFDGLLPALQYLHIPIPLGGTSNHFPVRVLNNAGGWDPFNVTEDADLGIRLARRGGTILMLNSTTWEEAPQQLPVWFRQRTRWLKGWMQTYLVHMRRPLKLLADLGLYRFLSFQLLIGGFLMSALLHPLFYVLIAIELTRSTPFQTGASAAEQLFWHIALFNLVVGYLAAILLAILTTARRGWFSLALRAPLMPIYWILVSLAAYRALVQLLRAPHLWEKTHHSARTRKTSAKDSSTGA